MFLEATDDDEAAAADIFDLFVVLLKDECGGERGLTFRYHSSTNVFPQLPSSILQIHPAIY
jgi:hypothetical protein